MKNKIRNPKFEIRNGFTLIELLVVIAIIGILTALFVANYNAARERGHDFQRKSDLDQVKKALQLYYTDNSLFPETGTSNVIKACGNPATTEFAWGSQFVCSGMVYMKALPKDPSTPDKTYTYEQTSNGHDFLLKAILDNHSDKNIEESQLKCLGSLETPQAYHYVVCGD